MSAETESPPAWWSADSMVCDRCNHAWVAVYPAGTEECECSQCGYEQPVACAHDMVADADGKRTCSKCGAVVERDDMLAFFGGLEALLGLEER
jgi:hypothetical protein